MEQLPLGLRSQDIRPPVLLEQQVFEDHFIFRFDETLAAGEFAQIHPRLPHAETSISTNTLTIRLAQRMTPGMPYLVRASVNDGNKNTLNFLARVYGKNLNPASLLINELNPEGSKSSGSPEVVELYVLKGGNLGGLTFTVGSLEENKGSFVFPLMDVVTGDFILLHTRWGHSKDLRRVNETTEKNQAKARLSSDQAWDFWAEDISGLSDTNEALALYQSPQGVLLDVVIYSTSKTGSRYRGWRTSYLERQVDRLSSGWKGQSSLVPEDAIRSKDSTGTRSLSRRHRNGVPIDTDSSADWIIVKTRKYSFGAVNSSEPHS
ncbi:MAG: hypothetical protein AAF975_03940 [Spirochaetota bacterium]